MCFWIKNGTLTENITLHNSSASEVYPKFRGIKEGKGPHRRAGIVTKKNELFDLE
jgi:hypothetical protein